LYFIYITILFLLTPIAHLNGNDNDNDNDKDDEEEEVLVATIHQRALFIIWF